MSLAEGIIPVPEEGDQEGGQGQERDQEAEVATTTATATEADSDAQADNELVFSAAKGTSRSWTSLFYGTEAEAKVLRSGGSENDSEEVIRNREDEGLFVPSVPTGSSKRVRDEILASNGKTSALSWSHTTAPVALQRFGPSEDPACVSRPMRKFVPNSEQLKVYHSNPHTVVDGSIDDQSFQLDVHVGNVEFGSHPLMTQEMYLTAQLKRFYRDYKRRERANMLEFYNRKIMTLEENILGARDAALGGWEDRLPQENASSLSNLKQLELSLIGAKEKLIREKDELKGIFQKLVDTYERLCSVRKGSGSINTNIELQVVDDPPDLRQAEARFKLDCRLLAAEKEDIVGLDKFSDLSGVSCSMRKLDCTAISYLNLKQQYASQVEELKESIADENQPSLSRAERNDIERRIILAEQKMVELGEFPQRVSVSDEMFVERARAAESEAKTLYETVHTLPKQKVILFARSDSQETQQPAESILTFDPRSMQRLRLSARLLINDKEVGQTEELTMNPDFTVDFNWSFSLQLYRWPEKARLQIYERQSILQSKHLISEIKLGIPLGDGENFEDLHPLSYDFSATVPYSPNWSVGDQTLYTHGEVFVHCRWANKMDRLLADRDDLEGGLPFDASINPLSHKVAPKPPQYVTETMSRSLEFRQSIKKNKARLREWLKSNKIDPNDPKNFDFLYLIDADVDRLNIREGSGFYSVSLPDDVKLELDPLVGRKRQVLLRSRWDKRLPRLNESSDPSGPVPLDERAIAMPNSAINQDLASADRAYSKRRFQASKVASSKEALEIIERRNTRIHKFLLKTKKKIKMARLATQKMKEIRVEDTVKEVILPEIKLDLRFLKNLFAPNRKLRPKRRAFKDIAIAPDDVEIVVGIEKGMHLPSRTQEAATDATATPSKTLQPKVNMKVAADHKLLRPYVEVIFQGKRSYSHISEGMNPIWNHEVRFPFSSVSGKITPSVLLNSKDRVTLNIFDLSDEDLGSEAEGGLESGNEKKAPGTFIGTTSVPVSSIYRGRICQGNFHLDVPVVLLGYDRAKSDCALSLYCTLQPSVSPPEEPKTSLLSRESDEIMSQSEVWVAYLKSLRQCKYRDFKPLVPNSENILNLITRYVSPLPLPPGYAAESTPDMMRVAKLVSLIPHVDAQEEFEDISEIWLGCSDFLSMCAGDSKVHAITLCNYFLTCGHDAYVVVGKSHAQANAYFVLTTNTPQGEEEKASKRFKFWSPYTGRFYASDDSGNELVAVSMIFNSKNIWANIQSHDEPWYMEWGDMENASEWLPFFNATFTAKDVIATNQKIPKYFKFNSMFFIELEASIEREIMNAITSARTFEYTHFNRRCSRMMKSLLQDLSQTDLSGSITNDVLESIKKKHDEELSSIERMYRIHGQPLCFPLTYMSEMQQAVLNTGVHKDFRNDVEMAVGVHVQYTEVNYICAIWIYVARLKKLWK
ncbi:coiled-coil and C2 domain-containing protein [Chloropicon primus]|nr:coiled-coil and C2 domain-containing protein [Chloropicon primus]